MGRAWEIPRLGWIIAFLGAVMLAAFAFSSLQGTRPARIASRLAPIAKVPEFELTDQAGKPFGLEDLRGKIWVADFIFTRCQGPCPVISSRMAELNRKIARAGRNVALVSFSVDPEFDRPEVLADYSAKLGADPSRWKFLTGGREEIEAIVGKGLLQPLTREPDGTPVHSAWIVLVDGEGQLRGYQDGLDPESVQKLLMDIGDLLRESPTGNP